MRRTDKQVTDRNEIDEIMNQAMVCRVAMCDGAIPYVVPLSFGYMDDFLYIHAACEGKKLDILKRNPSVAFEVDIDTQLITKEDLCECSFRYQSVVGEGTAVFLDSVEQKRKGLECIISHYTSRKATLSDTALGKVVVVRVDISSITGKKSGY